MAEPIYPSGVTVRGNVKLQAVIGAIADTDTPLLSEITASGNLDISCMVATEGWKPTLEPNKGTAKRRVCSKNDRQVHNASLYTYPDLLLSSDPQAEDGADGRKAEEILVPGLTIWIVERLGKDSIDVDWAVDQWVNLHRVTLGEQADDYDLTDENGEFYVRQPIVAAGSGAPIRRKKLVAA